ncbi:hypothetical protein PTKIN_Ptkin19aG0006000 [Pterospermum kingtungense]
MKKLKYYCEKNKGKDIDNKSNREILSGEEYSAAVILATLKHEKLEETCAIALEKLKRKFLQCPNYSINYECSESNLPPITALTGLIGICSRSFEKRLTQTDLNDHQMRLSLKKNHVKTSMLPLLEEKEDVMKGSMSPHMIGKAINTP